MTKHQTISLKLAQWLGHCNPKLVGESVCYEEVHPQFSLPLEFNPFAPTTEGRAQFAECVIKAELGEDEVHVIINFSSGYVHWLRRDDGWIDMPFDRTPESFTAATLEAIYYAIGGTADAWRRSSENASPD